MTEQDVFDEAREVCGKWPSFMSNPNLQAFAKRIVDKERNRLADELQKMPLNDTANSIAIWIREGGNA